ncbi:ABC transporter permease [Allorhizocola rhizosphaerae]|uniref:ABC transporter permease n=1 Tax=Allorhizocola rhizosphaerae TaxID=1872709 RepID=UPI000E3E19DA|nr:ABC transporter permease [Allorhizocola rhizosphaerae]
MITARIIWYSVCSGLADYTLIFTWRTWLFGWYLRILAQVLFFASIGWLLSPNDTRYLLVGNAVAMMSVHSLFTTSSTAWERRCGTLPLIVASPARPIVVLASRSLYWMAEGFVCALGSMLGVGWLLGVSLPLEQVLWCVPLLLLIGLSTYALGLLLGALVLNRTDLRNVVSNAVTAAMMAVCGVNVPAEAFGPFAGAVAQLLPLTHGLAAVRTVLDGGPAQVIAAQAIAEAAVGVAWFAAAVGVLHWMQWRARRDGSIVFAE